MDMVIWLLIMAVLVAVAVAPGKYLRYRKYHLSFDDGKIFADIV
jgi:hypothetical protein